MKDFWKQLYISSYQNISKKITKINGLFVGLNTNVDVILNISPEIITQLIKDFNIDTDDLVSAIETWKGKIDEPIDYVSGLCGCFKYGKASEWIIQGKEVYEKLLEKLPELYDYRMGGQAGIMANVLAQLGVPRILVNVMSLSLEQKRLFLENKAIQVPILDHNNELKYLHPNEVNGNKQELHLHIISEFKKNSTLVLSESDSWLCPRDNRFIATYDPPNSRLEMTEGAKQGINEIATMIDGFIISGFHMLDTTKYCSEDIRERISQLMLILKQAKNINPKIICQIELCSIKDISILSELLKAIQNEKIWDSISCNERELAEVLAFMGREDLSLRIKDKLDIEALVKGTLFLCKKLSLKRLHLHTYGMYILIVDKNEYNDFHSLQQTLCFASIITSLRANGDSILFDNISEHDISKLVKQFKISALYQHLKAYISEKGSYENLFMKEPGIIDSEKYAIIAIPTIIIENPVLTVGLGDTISASTLAAEIALEK